VQPISDFIFLNDTVKHVSFIKCAFSGNLNILFEQNKIESFTFIDNWSQLDSTSLEKLLNMSNLEVLDISQNSHIDFSNNVSKLKKIKSLKLGGLHLRQLPIGIFELPELQILDLSNNYIRDIPLDFSKSPKKQAFFPIIDSLTFEIINEKTIFISQLSSLNLSNNCLTNFSIDLTGLEAMYIDLSHNNFTEPPKGLYSLSSNQTVRLDACLKPKIDTARLKCIVEFDE
jgi:Leucine-rich repeat (LRR) protein